MGATRTEGSSDPSPSLQVSSPQRPQVLREGEGNLEKQNQKGAQKSPQRMLGIRLGSPGRWGESARNQRGHSQGPRNLGAQFSAPGKSRSCGPRPAGSSGPLQPSPRRLGQSPEPLRPSTNPTTLRRTTSRGRCSSGIGFPAAATRRLNSSLEKLGWRRLRNAAASPLNPPETSRGVWATPLSGMPQVYWDPGPSPAPAPPRGRASSPSPATHRIPANSSPVTAAPAGSGCLLPGPLVPSECSWAGGSLL